MLVSPAVGSSRHRVNPPPHDDSRPPTGTDCSRSLATQCSLDLDVSRRNQAVYGTLVGHHPPAPLAPGRSAVKGTQYASVQLMSGETPLRPSADLPWPSCRVRIYVNSPQPVRSQDYRRRPSNAPFRADEIVHVAVLEMGEWGMDLAVYVLLLKRKLLRSPVCPTAATWMVN